MSTEKHAPPFRQFLLSGSNFKKCLSVCVCVFVWVCVCGCMWVCVGVGVCVGVLLAINPCSMSESWGGGVPTSEHDHYGPSLLHLLLRILNLNPPRPLLLLTDFRPRVKPTTAPPKYLSLCRVIIFSFILVYTQVI